MLGAAFFFDCLRIWSNHLYCRCKTLWLTVSKCFKDVWLFQQRLKWKNDGFLSGAGNAPGSREKLLNELNRLRPLVILDLKPWNKFGWYIYIYIIIYLYTVYINICLLIHIYIYHFQSSLGFDIFLWIGWANLKIAAFWCMIWTHAHPCVWVSGT